MCQVYKTEANYIKWKGFRAAVDKKPLRSNPYHRQYEMYQHVEWASGWYCFKDYGNFTESLNIW